MPPWLRFRVDGTFTIVQFTDTHFTATREVNGDADARTLALITEVLEAEQPDLVIYTGDVIDGGRCPDPEAALRLALSPVVAKGLPWAAVFGNHDDEGSLSRAALMAVQQSIPGSLSQPGPAQLTGVSNYTLQVLDARGEEAAANLYFLDSNSYSKTGVGVYDWIHRDQVTWFAQIARELAELNGGESLPALAFFHIPLPEYHEVWDYHTCYGVKREEICAPFVNSGLFAAMHEAGDVLGTFVGHDHINDFIGELYGIRLAYGRATGYNTYGREGMARGARVIHLTQGVRDFDTWLRLAGGEVVRTQPVHVPEGRRTVSA